MSLGYTADSAGSVSVVAIEPDETELILEGDPSAPLFATVDEQSVEKSLESNTRPQAGADPWLCHEISKSYTDPLCASPTG